MSETTAKTITLLDKSAKALVKSKLDLLKTMNELGTLIDSSETIASDIEFKDSELAQIKDKIDAEFRTAKAELQIQILENEDKVLSGLMDTRKLATITAPALEALQADLSSATSDNASAIDKAVAVAVQAATTKHNYAQKDLQSSHEVASATLESNAVALNNEIVFLKRALADSQDTLRAERDARISIAASEAQAQGVTVNTSGK